MQRRETQQGPRRADTAEAERERRLQVLHELAQEAHPLERPSATSLVTPEPVPEQAQARMMLSPDRRALWARARRQRLLRAGIFVLVVALVVGTVFAVQIGNPLARFGSTSRPPAATAGPLSINPSAGSVDCLFDATWSPQGTSIAAIGSKTCYQGPYNLTIFDANSGKVQHQVNLDAVADPVVAQALGAAAGQVSVFYRQVLWSATGRLAVLFDGVQIRGAVGNQPPPAAEGLVLTDATGIQLQALAQAIPPATPLYYAEWDLTSDKGSILPDAIASNQSENEYLYATVTPWLQYKWDFSGGLYGAQPLPNPSDPAAAATQLAVAVGNPTTGPFSIWQHGDLVLTQGASTFATWNTYFGAWAPDGSRIVDAFNMAAVLQPLGQTSFDHSVLSGTNFIHAPLLLVRDAGMQAVLTALQSDAASTGAAQLAWRPDGKVLAAQSALGPLSSRVSNHAITLYDCSNGKVLVTLAAPPSHGSAQPIGSGLLRWSADGTRLLLFDPALHTLAVWGPSMLPKS